MTRRDYLLLSGALHAVRPDCHNDPLCLEGIRLAATAIGLAITSQRGGFDLNRFLNDVGVTKHE